MSGYISNTSKNSGFKNIKFKVEFFNNDNGNVCWVDEAQAEQVISADQRVKMIVILPKQLQSRSPRWSDCGSIRWKVISSEVL